MKNRIRRFLIRLLFSRHERYTIWVGMTNYTAKWMEIDTREGMEANELRELFMKMELRKGVNISDAIKAISALQSDVDKAILVSPDKIRNN